MKKYVPHFFTSLNLICGCIAILLLSKDNYTASVIICLLAFLFDFADGFFARLLKTESSLGRQLDSFSDFITSGLVPGILMYKLLIKSGFKEILIFPNLFNFNFHLSPLSLAGFLITIATAFRLSKFNLMKTEHKYFLGLPAPANCIMIIGLPFMFDILGEKYLNYNLLLIITVFSIYLLNSNIKLISFKNIKISIVLLLFFLIAALTILTNFAILTILIFIYILSSMVYFKFKS
ncbi:MAG: phosphatidylserine synthase [Flavobacteriaceae bacterium]|nr:phosphatidylserine synthase [Flavobacteriaceae bacterium]|tara:strand:+ start:3202 stop:3906 length:705 start_codon:yes stop_codon:yes gene_type:complete